MTYLADISEHSTSPVAKMLRLLDKEIDDLMGDAAGKLEKAVSRERAAAISSCIQVITFDNLDDIRNVAMLRYEARNPDAAAEEDED